MKRKQWIYLLTGCAGLVGWLLFVLACTGWPAWSPDSRRILFPYLNPDSKDSGIALYDRTAGTVVPVFRELAPESNAPLPYAQFTQDGKQIVVLLFDPGEGDPADEVFLLPVEGKKTLRRFMLPHSKQFSFPPFPEYGNQLFLGLSYIARVNLKTGEVETRELKGGKGIHLIPDGERIWYVMYDLEREGREGDGFQVGEMSRNDLGLKSLFELWDTDMNSRGITRVSILGLTPIPGGLGLATSGRMGDDPALVFFNRAGLDRVVTPQFPGKGYRLGRLAWSADGKTIYTTAVAPGKTAGAAEFSVAEIPVSGGPVRLTWIAHLTQASSEKDLESFEPFLAVSLSPDGHTLA